MFDARARHYLVFRTVLIIEKDCLRSPTGRAEALAGLNCTWGCFVALSTVHGREAALGKRSISRNSATKEKVKQQLVLVKEFWNAFEVAAGIHHVTKRVLPHNIF